MRVFRSLLVDDIVDDDEPLLPLLVLVLLWELLVFAASTESEVKLDAVMRANTVTAAKTNIVNVFVFVYMY